MPIFSRSTRHLLLGFACCASLLVGEASAANWSVTAGGALVLDTSASGLTVGGMSGLAYVGPAPTTGKHRFLAVQDTGAGVVTFDAEFDLGGGLLSAAAVSNQPLGVSLDFEGIAHVGSSLFLSDETGPGVREFDPTSGNQLQSVTIPSVFANARGNRGFESLAFDESTATLWTANEEALTVDGAPATQASGTTVRLLELNVNGSALTAGGQFAYEVEPIHGFAITGARSGLAELISMPDGTLLALERSAALALPPILNQVYEIGFAGATDVSVGTLAGGLQGESFTPVSKQLLWSGSIAGGENLEGMAIGPRLPNGAWAMLGVVDNGGNGANTIAAFTAIPTTPIPLAADSADFDDDGDVDGADYLAWQRGMDVATLAGAAHGDANHDGQVTGADLAIWQNQYAVSTSASAQAVPEPTSAGLLLVAIGFAAPRATRYTLLGSFFNS